MDSRIGLDYVVENPEYIAKLAGALDTGNVTVKKQVLELLSALCVYNAEGYARALDALEHYKELKGDRYRFHVIISELRGATTIDYQTAIVAFINCLIISTPQLKDRIKIRNEFIGLKLLPVLNDLRRLAGKYPDLGVQLDVFDEQRESDEAQLLQGPYGVDLNSHLDVFYAILRQVADTPQEIPFLSILQHLLRIDPKEPVSDVVWDTAETLVHRATLLESRQDATRLLRSPSQTKLCCPCACHQHRGGTTGSDIGSRKQSLNTTPSTPSTQSAAFPPPPPPPPPPTLPGPPPPPPPPPLCPPGPPPLPGKMGGPPVPPPLHTPVIAPARSPEPPDTSNKLLPQQETPTPKAKMKTINWNKIPNHKVVGKHNIWSLVANSHQHSPMADLDWAEMEGLFCQQVPPVPSAQSSPKLGRDLQDPDRRRKESSEIVLLDGKRSLNVNIFLKQFRSCNEDIIQLIRDGAHDDIGAEKLRGLLKLLPEVDELEMLKAFDGDKTKLGNAEKFLLQLIQVPNYKLRIESMLLKEEFAANMGYLEPSINSMIVAGEDLMTNKPLQEVLYMVLVAGNFLNSGGYAGNAAGVKLSSLQKLTDIRANKPGMNLIHFVALQIEKKRKDLLHFPEEMTILEEATKTTVEQLQNEINALDTRIKKIRKLIDQPSTENEIKMQMGEFLQMAEQEVIGLQRDMEELESTRKALSDFFCEDPNTFKIEECFRVFHGFCTKFRQAVTDNERRKIQEEQANARRRQREEQLAAKRKQYAGQIGSTVSESESNLVDPLLYDITSGLSQNRSSEKDSKNRKFQNGSMTSEEDISITGSPLVTRRRMGSFSGPAGEQVVPGNKDDGYSPDITPNGSLRRRRSRVPSEEDDSNLMDFLRSSGQESGRERKSWGSLDRSWARRARGGGRKRPDLLSADFSGERERPNSPSPLAENKPVLPASTENETKPKAWRQKIEAWLQENEKEEKQSEELRRRSRRVQSNRRSLELDSESDGRGSTLDTLPEEKSTPSNTQYKRVYSDWRPTIEKTDVAGVIEAIEEAQPQTHVKDKSPWRKSNLNVSNSTEDTQTDIRKLRRMRSRGSMDGPAASGTLHSIKEEGKKKEIIEALGQGNAQERLTLYIRKPSEAVDPEDSNKLTLPVENKDQRRPRSMELSDSGSSSHPNSPLMSRSQLLQKYRHSMEVADDFLKSIVGDKTSASSVKENEEESLPPSVPRRQKKQNEDICVSDRIEIDSDNIETPPVTRRNFKEPRGGNRNLDDETRSRKSPQKSSGDDKSVPDLSLDVLRRRFINKDMEALNNKSNKIATKDTNLQSENPTAKLNEDEEILGDGQFNRFSSARRTRRYKKNNTEISDKEASSSHGEETSNSPIRRADVVSPELVSEKQIMRPATLKVQSYVVSGSPLKSEDTESRLKKWQDRLKYKGGKGDCSDIVTEEAVANITNAGVELQNLDRVTNSYYKSPTTDRDEKQENQSDRIHRSNYENQSNRARVRSFIDQRQVQEALNLGTGSTSLDRAIRSRNIKADLERNSEEFKQKIFPNNVARCSTAVREEILQGTDNNSQIKNEFVPEIKIQSLTPGHTKGPNKNEHDLNDEGFEETQSLISETPSQGTSSGCNYEADVTDSPKKSTNVKRRPGRIIRADSSGSGDTSSSTNPAQLSPTTTNIKMPLKKGTSVKVLNNRNEISKNMTADTYKNKSSGISRYSTIERSSSLRTPKVGDSERMKRSGIALHRNGSLKKTDSQNSLSSRASSGILQKKKSVERSNSRTSLRSSRSSLNSSTSVNTVKNIPPLSRSSSINSTKAKTQLSGYTSAIKNLTTNLNKEVSNKFGYQSTNRGLHKKPLTPVQPKSGTKSVPASRSSSSGSSIGPTVRRPRVTTGISTSFKENAETTREPGVPASRSSSSGSSIGPTIRKPKQQSNITILQKEMNSPVGRIPSHCGLSFMRPTASSSAKDHTGITEPSVKLRTIARTIK